jgi:hypothetical protein
MGAKALAGQLARHGILQIGILAIAVLAGGLLIVIAQ